MTITTNIQATDNARESLKSHCLCFKLDEDARIVYLPEGYSIDAIRVSKPCGKAEMFSLMEQKLEQIWKESLF